MFNNYFLDLLFSLTEKEIKARYKNAILGLLWIFIIPLLQMVVMGFVFSLIFKFNIKNYYLFLFTGLLPWNFFSQALNKAVPRIVFDRSLIQKSNFPKEVIPLSMVLSHFYHFFVSWIMLIIFLAITKQWQFFTLSAIGNQLLAITLLLIFTSGISLLTSSLNVFYRDINFVVQAGTMIWFYLTPIVYPLNIIPQKYLWVFYLNPLSGIFTLLQKPFSNQSFPLQILIGQVGLIGIISILGVAVFRKLSKYFADWI